MKPIQKRKDCQIKNQHSKYSTGSVYLSDPKLNNENQLESMLTSPRSNASENFLPSHHLALITQPVLAARSRSKRKTTTNILVETSNKDKFDSMTNSRQSSFNDSPPLILPINRIDTLQYQKKSHHYHESPDSGVDSSFSTNSSVQTQQYPNQHIQIHRPLSALNEDSSQDDGYIDEHQQNPVRLRFPPVHFPRNRSMEDILNNNSHEHPQHRSSSFSDEKQQKLSLQQDKQLKRVSDGALLDYPHSSQQTNDLHRKTNINNNRNEHIYSTNNQQQPRSFNDLTSKNCNRVLPTSNESNMLTAVDNLSSTQTLIRKPNISTLKPLRKKTKLNLFVEPPTYPLTTSRLAVYDEQINGTNSSSSNQTTPRSNTKPIQQQIKSKTSTPISHYSNQEQQFRVNVNRSVADKQQINHLPTSTSRRGVIQQMIPFDASPSKVNNLLLRHHIQQNQPAVIFYPKSNSPNLVNRQIKVNLPVLSNDELSDEKRKQIKEKKSFKLKDDFQSNQINEIHSKGQDKIKSKDNQEFSKRQNSHEQFDLQKSNGPFVQKQQDKHLKLKYENETNIPHRHSEYFDNQQDFRQRKTNFIETNRYSIGDSIVSQFDLNNNRKQQINQEQFVQKTKSNGVVLRNKNVNTNNYFQKTNTRPAKIYFQKYETNPTNNQKFTRIQPINSNLSETKRERETSRLSFVSKTDSKQRIHENYQQQSPTSWSTISKHQTNQQQLQFDRSRSPSSQTNFHRDISNASSKTYRLNQQQTNNDKYHQPSNTLQAPSENDQSFQTASHHTYPFTLSSQDELDDDKSIHSSEKTNNPNPIDIYHLTDEENLREQKSPSPLVHLSSKQKHKSIPSSPLKKVTLANEYDEIITNYDSDDGWSDDSAELLYVDERYANEKFNNIPSSHLNSQQHYQYHLQQQNVLLQ